jgi:hypothetical protein
MNQDIGEWASYSIVIALFLLFLFLAIYTNLDSKHKR